MLITNRDTGATFTAFNGRYDQWRNLTGDALRTARIRYWGTMASLHYHFRHVISYLDNAEHHNHAHIDNAVSGSGDSSFTTGSATQTYFVQAACQYIWGYSTGIDGDWGPQTQRDSSAALARAGSDGVITTQSRWLASWVPPGIWKWSDFTLSAGYARKISTHEDAHVRSQRC